MVLKKYEIEAALHAEHKAIQEGQLKEDNPLDQSEEFRQFCEACRRGDLKTCQEKLQEGANINARDRFDYTPLILASLCGHYEVCQLLLESGALCERDTFQGERCLYNALNDRIRNLLLSYDYSKSRDPLQPLASHLTSLLNLTVPQTSDITLVAESTSFKLHKFILAARSPYFAKKLASAPDTVTWKVPISIPTKSLEIAILGLYLSEVNVDFGASEEEQAILAGIDKLGKQLEIDSLLDTIIESNRRIQRQKRGQEVERGRLQLDGWFHRNVLHHAVTISREKVDGVRWDRQNNIFADVLLCATEEDEPVEDGSSNARHDIVHIYAINEQSNGIPVGPAATTQSRSRSRSRAPAKSVLFPVHRAMLLRSEYFSAMFSSPFKEAQDSEHLPIVHVDCTPAVLRVILAYLYTEQASFGLDTAIEVLFVADFLMIEKLKVKAAMIISTLGNGVSSVVEAENPRGETIDEEEDALDIYEVVRAGWQTRVHRLEEFGARYMAYRLEHYIDQEDFKQLVRESAARIKGRQETDTVELIDDIRFYLSERFRLRFEDAGIDEMTEEEERKSAGAVSETEAKVQKDGWANGDGTKALAMSETEAETEAAFEKGMIRTLDGDEAGDEFTQDALNYQILLGKIDTLLENLHLDA
ncbi:MAG: hypothetical protein Q9162_001227 [Coniocarpon cinnabarinum]